MLVDNHWNNLEILWVYLETQIEQKCHRRTLYKIKVWFPGDIVQAKLFHNVIKRHWPELDPKTTSLLVRLSLLTFKKCKPSKESVVRGDLRFCDNDPSFEGFSVLAKASSKFSLEIKESLLIKRDTPNLNRNTASAELLLFDSR